MDASDKGPVAGCGEQILYFGDQNVNGSYDLSQIQSLARLSPIVDSFFRLSDAALSKAIARLPRRQRETLSPYKGLKHYLSSSELRKTSSQFPSGVLLCICQLSCLLFHADRDPRIISSERNVAALGLCTGMLPAIASISADNVACLHDIAIEITLVCFRLECELIERAQTIEQGPGAWAVACKGTAADGISEELEIFNNTLGENARNVFLSARGRSSVTLSGPPSSLDRFLSGISTSGLKRRLDLPVYAPFHAPHLHSPNIDGIVGNAPILNTSIRANALVISTSTGEPIANSQDVRGHLCEAVQDIVSRTLDLELVTRRLGESSLKSVLRVLIFGPVVSSKFIIDACSPGQVAIDVDHGTKESQRLLSDRSDSDLFAVVGMAGRFPGADSVEEFWDILENARAMHKKIPADRFDIATHVDETGNKKNTSLTPWGAFIDSAGLFDNLLFKISPKEAPRLDPMHRLLLMTCFEALETAGYQKDRTPSTHHTRIGTYYGCSSDDWRQSNSAQDIDGHFIPGANRCFGPGRLNYHFDWEGPSYSIDTACSSSAAAIQLAMNGIKSGDCDTAVAGGSSISTCSDIFAGLSRGGFLSATGPCKTFLEGGDGYCRADAVGCVVIKRLEAAEADNDNILAVIRACSTNHSAQATSLTRPHAPTQETLFRRTLRQGGVNPSQVDYVEMHGTGTVAGDAGESSSVSRVFLNDPTRSSPLHVGSIKPNVGHSEAASGVSSFIKALLMLRHGTIPPHIIGGQKFNPDLPHGFETMIPRSKMPLGPGSEGKRNKMILINNFNAAGGNTSLLLEEYTKTVKKTADPRDFHTVTLSANSELSLTGNLQRLTAYLEHHQERSLADMAYTTTSRRMHHKLRMAFVAESTSDLLSQMQQASTAPSQVSIPKHRGIAFTFPGQGCIYDGMGQQLFATSETFRSSILRFDRVCVQQGFPSISHGLASSVLQQTSRSTLLNQLMLVAMEIALYDLWTSWGIQPDIVIGHSLGEYPALYAAGVLSLSDTIYLVGKRATLLQQQLTPDTDSMFIARCPANVCEALIDASSTCSCEIACVNGPRSTVVSGPKPEMETLKHDLEENGVKGSELNLPYAFHSAQMDPILKEYEAAARHIPLQESKVAIASGMYGTVIPAGSQINHDFLVQQMRRPVLFQQAVQSCEACGFINADSLWIEMGPGSACSTMIRSTLGVPHAICLTSMKQGESEWSTIFRSLAQVYEHGLDVSWPDLHQEYEQEHLTLLDLPTYHFDLTHYWIQYEGDWMVQKGQARIERAPTATAQDFIDGSLHKVLDEHVDDDTVSVAFSTDPTAGSMKALLSGHTIFGSTVCSTSIYADMAQTASAYAQHLQSPTVDVPAFEIRDMQISYPLLIDFNDLSSHIRVSLSQESSLEPYTITFGKSTTDGFSEAATCLVAPSSAFPFTISDTISHLITSRIFELTNPLASVSKLNQAMVYKLLSDTVSYAASYQGLDEVYLSASSYEAVGRVTFKTSTGEEDQFAQCPYWLDSLFHIAFFVLNASTMTENDQMYISTGWKVLSIATVLKRHVEYTVYVKMREEGEKAFGDVYVLEEGSKIVAVCEGLHFQRLKKSSARRLFVSSTASRTGKDAAMADSAAISDTPGLAEPVPLSLTLPKSLLVEAVCKTEPKTIRSLKQPPPIAAKPRNLSNRRGRSQSPALSDASTLPGDSRATDSEVDSRPCSRSRGHRVLKPPPTSAPTKTIDARTCEPNDSDRRALLRTVVASELEVDPDSIGARAQLADLGLDSILGISAMKAAKQKGFALEAGFFMKHATLDEMEKALGI